MNISRLINFIDFLLLNISNIFFKVTFAIFAYFFTTIFLKCTPIATKNCQLQNCICKDYTFLLNTQNRFSCYLGI